MKTKLITLSIVVACILSTTICGCNKPNDEQTPPINNNDNKDEDKDDNNDKPAVVVVAKLKLTGKQTVNNHGFWIISIDARESYSPAGKIVRYTYLGGESQTENPSENGIYEQTKPVSYQPIMGVYNAYNSPNSSYYHAKVIVYDENGNRGESEWVSTTKPR